MSESWEDRMAEQIAAIYAALHPYTKENGTGALPLLAVVQMLVADWQRLHDDEREEAERWAADDKADAEFEEFSRTATPEQIDAALVAEGFDPADVRRTAQQFGRFMPFLFKTRDRATAAEDAVAALVAAGRKYLHANESDLPRSPEGREFESALLSYGGGEGKTS